MGHRKRQRRSQRGTQQRELGEGLRRPVEPIGWSAFVALAVLCVALYGRSVAFGYTRTDDTVQLVDSARFVGSLANLPKAFAQPFSAANGSTSYYRPIVTVTYMLDAAWTGVRPLGYHLTNVVLHLAAGGLFLLLARRLALGTELSLLGAALLVAHPGLTEAVAWIPGRGDSLLAIWFMAAALCLFRWLDTGSTRALVAHSALLLLALFTKEAATTLPLAFLGFVVLVAGKSSILRGPHLWAAWLGPILIWYFSWRGALASTSNPAASGHAAEALRHLPVLLMFLGKAVWPSHMSVLAVEQDTTWLPGALALLPIGVALYWLRGRHRRLFLWGLGVFVLLLAPSLAVSDFLILEIRLYAPLVGLLVATLALLQQTRERWPQPLALRVPRGAAAIVLGVLALRAGTYVRSFEGAEPFTAQAAQASPHSGLARLNRGIVRYLANDLGQAEAEYQATLALDANLPVLHNNLGLIELRRGNPDQAEGLFREELSLNPTYDKASVNLALALKSLGRLEEAAGSLHEALEHNPYNEDALEGLASYYAFRGDAALATSFSDRLRAARAFDGGAAIRSTETKRPKSGSR